MASSEKQMFPLNDIPPKDDNFAEQLPTTSTTDLVPAKFPSRARRKVAVILFVIAVSIVIIVAAGLIGKYVPEYLNDASSKSEKGSKDKGTGEGEGNTPWSIHSPSTSPSAETTLSLKSMETKTSLKASSYDKQQVQTSSLPVRAATLSTATYSMSDTPIMPSSRSDIRASTASSVAADLSVIANLLPNTESKWSRWSSWSDCTKTCGTGTRYRSRTCVAIDDRAVFAPITCAGKSNQVKSCAEWSCPDCSRNCTVGTLNSACDACTCAHHELSGRVLTEDNIPLSEANISLAETPYNVLAQTNISGYFSTLGICAIQQEVLVTKAGFVPVKLAANVTTPTTATMTAKLEIAVPPFVTVHPESKLRMPGQSVTFCCDGEGNPPPEIEWFKENNVIDKEMFNYNNILEISDVSGLNGTFRCRVINQFGAEFSNPAELTVLENSVDSCPAKPDSKNDTLPPGCVVNGTNSSTVDVGECEPAACVKRGLNFSSSCSETSLCCGPRSYASVSIQCGAFMSFDILKIKTCGCGNCTQKQTIIEGFAVGEDERGVKLVDVFFGGKSVARTDSNGKFSFIVPITTKRAIVTFKDLLNQKYEEEDRIFALREGQMAIYRVKLKPKPKPVTFNASEPLDLPLGDESDSFADLELPENALLTEDGSVFNGNAKATVSVTDPRNQSDIESAPGDFSTMSEDGEEEMLQTYGMMKLNLEDDSGKPLTMAKPMKVYLDPEKLNLTSSNGNSSIKLYWLDRKTGRWREAGDFLPVDGSKRRRKRSNRVVLEGKVTPFLTKYNLNLDKVIPKVALRVIIKHGVDTAIDQHLSDVLVKVICKDERDVYKGLVEGTTNRNGVLCINIFKNSTCYVQAGKDTKFYVPDPSSGFYSPTVETNDGKNTIKVFKFESTPRPPQKEPMYDVLNTTEMAKCEQSLDKSKKPILPKESQFVFTPPERSSLVPTPYSLRSSSFASDTEKACFINVKVNASDIKLLKKVLIMAVSYNPTITRQYGFHLTEPEVKNDGLGKACLRIQCPIKGVGAVLVLVSPMIMATGTTCSCQIPDGSLFDSGFVRNEPYCKDARPTVKGLEKWLCIPYSFRSFAKYEDEPPCKSKINKFELQCQCR